MQRPRQTLFSLLTLLLLISGCVAPVAPVTGDITEDADILARGGTLTIARPTDAVGLDPKVETTSPGNWVMSNIYENLVKLDTDLTFQPALAKSWEQVEPNRWRFILRQGVKFHDNTDFTAEAVKFSIERQKDPDNPGRSASNLRPILGVQVVDDYIVRYCDRGCIWPATQHHIAGLCHGHCEPGRGRTVWRGFYPESSGHWPV